MAKIVVDKLPLESCDVQMIEIPKGAKVLSAAGFLEEAGGGLINAEGKKAARIRLALFIAYNPEEEARSYYKIYILGMGVPNEVSENIKFECSCQLVNGMIFHIFSLEVDEDGNEVNKTIDPHVYANKVAEIITRDKNEKGKIILADS